MNFRLLVTALCVVGFFAPASAQTPDLAAIARESGTPDIPGLKVVWLAPWGEVSKAYPWRNIHGYIEQIFDAFGPHRSFWGTDITRMPCSYRQCVTMFTEELSFLSGTDKELVMGRALCAWIDWKLPGV